MTNSEPHVPRVLMTADTLGGVWTYSLELARALQPYGVEIALATMGRRLSRAQRQEAAATRNLTIYESTYKLEWMNEPWEDVERAGEWLLDLQRKVRPSVVHLNGYVHGVLPWEAPKIVVGHSCVLSWWRAVHGTKAPPEWDTYRRAVSAGLKAADAVVTPSRAMLESLRYHYGPLNLIAVIPNGRSCPPLRPRPKERLVLTAGRLWDAGKNVQALAQIALELPWPVFCAGQLKSPDSDGHTYPQVCCLGRLSPARLWQWYARAAIYALPARYEPFGLSVLGAALAGCALVLGDLPSLREIWGEAAVYVSPEDPQELKHVLRELMSSPILLAELGSRAHSVASQFSPERMARSYMALYNRLTTKKAADALKYPTSAVEGDKAEEARHSHKECPEPCKLEEVTI
ncbi:MAG TPA: glycosyltransferase family 4 protein [Candidatus Limnocylindrales bacterium]|jgi:glycosyltransferase involved in cell wall biosynthesis|nr:glycosyltransferase family 4 protein [Candidatus Limnocylindrales bacterium]